MLVWRGRGAEATSLLVSQAGLVASRRPALAAVMYADAASGATTTDSYLEAERLARRAAGLLRDRAAWDAGTHGAARPGPAGHGAVLATLCLRGKAPEARLVLGEAARLARGLDPLGPDWPWLHMIRQCHIPLWDFERAQAESLELARLARDAGALAALSGLLQVAADTAFRLGDWDAADAAALEAIGVAGDVGQPVVTGWALTIRTRILAARGRREESLAAAQAALRIAGSERISAGLRFAHAALGFGELGRDRTGAAISALETAERLVRGTGMEEPTIVPWAPDLIEAYARQGRPGDARRVLTSLERQAASTASPVAGAAAARGRGMIDDDFEPAFARALALDARRPMPFEFHLRQIYRKLGVHSRTQLIAVLADRPETAETARTR